MVHMQFLRVYPESHMRLDHQACTELGGSAGCRVNCGREHRKTFSPSRLSTRHLKICPVFLHCFCIVLWFHSVQSNYECTVEGHAAVAAETPTCSAVAIAARALSWLWVPVNGQQTWPTILPCCKTSKSLASPCAVKSLTAAPKLRTSRRLGAGLAPAGYPLISRA